MFEKIKDIILQYNDVPPESITPDTSFLADIHMNSLNIAAMAGDIEDEFDISIEMEDMSGIYTIRQLMDYIKEKEVT